MENIDSRIPPFGFRYCLLQRVDSSLADFCNTIGQTQTFGIAQELPNYFVRIGRVRRRHAQRGGQAADVLKFASCRQVPSVAVSGKNWCAAREPRANSRKLDLLSLGTLACAARDRFRRCTGETLT